MKIGYDNGFDVLCDARDDQEQDAHRNRADALRADPAFIQSLNDNAAEFDGSNWASIGRAAQRRDLALAQERARYTLHLETIEEEHRQRIAAAREGNARAVAGIFEAFESLQKARLNFLAWKATA